MYDYAFVHVIWTIPIAILLTVVLRPLCTKLDLYKICFLCTVAFTYTIPWDSYLIRTGIWTYPPDVILGVKVYDIPAEELFFFLIQTYITTVLQILVNKSTLLPAYLRNEAVDTSTIARHLTTKKWIGQVVLAAGSVIPWFTSTHFRTGRYMSLIFLWAFPVLLMLWSFAYQLLLTLPWSKTWLPIWLPTLYLWLVDTLALQRGTWSIVSGTKLGFCIVPHLEIEEATFFLATNTLIVWGSTAFDNAIAILDSFPEWFPEVSQAPSPFLMIKSLLLPTAAYNEDRLAGLRNALVVLARKSRSFYLASGVFGGRLRLDLILLYSFCRIADDLIDDAADAVEAQNWINHFTEFLDIAYSKYTDKAKLEAAIAPFPSQARQVLRHLPVDKLPPKPLYSLLDGFKIDLQFLNHESKRAPIQTEADLEKYAFCVASTVGELCLSLVYYHNPDRSKLDSIGKARCIDAGRRMGRALQYINIARDVTTDAAVGRCYIPDEWFDKAKRPRPEEAREEEVLEYRQSILRHAFDLYAENREAIEELPVYARDGIRVAVESYVEIGRVLAERLRAGQSLDFAGGGKKGRASVPKLRRLWVGWRAMAGRRGTIERLERL